VPRCGAKRTLGRFPELYNLKTCYGFPANIWSLSAAWRAVLGQCAPSPQAFCHKTSPGRAVGGPRRVVFFAAGANGTNMRQCWSTRRQATASDYKHRRALQPSIHTGPPRLKTPTTQGPHSRPSLSLEKLRAWLARLVGPSFALCLLLCTFLAWLVRDSRRHVAHIDR
jgi:hypothetical protein